ncbi:EndA1 [Desulforapulum autotrophicum HRM2]|uniref:EndA1 n=1 Tax=Desulforapulum autotrophicum (strain ATCC 43914 / DSM 3382 / VKM B-1955 / HRM2) TaxID=177437 RepID=C0QB38_DESAH|nr:endonuclease [Desulforapulum autotrophicum]ACN14837.1 EndA1 [Desulforapulum autotrophicum HRM2]
MSTMNHFRRFFIPVVLLSICLLSISQACAGSNTKIDSFSKAKRLLLNQVYYDHRITFYCGCPFTAGKQIIPSDKFSPTTKHVKRSRKVEWEHVVPAQAFGQSFFEWRKGDPGCVDRKGKAFKGRKCAEKVNMEYRHMQADLYNLVPANGQVNALRSNYSYAMIPGEPRAFGNCDMEIENRKAEPCPEIHGDIARIYFYMADAYPGRGIISKKNRKLFQAWAKEDPVDDWERERCARIERLQGNKNRFVN